MEVDGFDLRALYERLGQALCDRHGEQHRSHHGQGRESKGFRSEVANKYDKDGKHGRLAAPSLHRRPECPENNLVAQRCHFFWSGKRIALRARNSFEEMISCCKFTRLSAPRSSCET